MDVMIGVVFGSFYTFLLLICVTNFYNRKQMNKKFEEGKKLHCIFSTTTTTKKKSH